MPDDPAASNVTCNTISSAICTKCGAAYKASHKKCDTCRKIRAKVVSAYLWEKKSHRCVHCGIAYHPSSMQFDHVRGEKLFNLADASRMGASDKEIDAELAKCEVVCGNCHLLRNYCERSGVSLEEGFRLYGKTWHGFSEQRSLMGVMRSLYDQLCEAVQRL